MTERNQPYFPVQTSSRITHAQGEANGYENEILGGLTMREEAALRIFCALCSNPALVTPGLSSDKLRELAWRQADKFIEEGSE